MCLASRFYNDEPIFEKILAFLQKSAVTKFICRTFISRKDFNLGGFQRHESFNDTKFY